MEIKSVTKDRLRRQFLQIRKNIPEEARRQAERQIAQRLFETELYQTAGRIYCYAAFREEAGTGEILTESLRQGKPTAVPRVMGKRKMEFFYLRSMEDLRPGTWSIPEPGPWCTQAPKPDETCLVIMPGAAFDREGNRLGYGGGYYDTYLADCPQCLRAALAFAAQCTDHIPADPHDIRPDIIITEKELIKCFQDFRETR